MSADVRIGTSGWHYKHWIGRYYPPRWAASKMLDYYQRDFDTVELNNSFYRLPVKSGLRKWRESTPANFLFAAKGSRFITHMKKLRDPEPALARFFDHIEVLGDKLGPILFQLPPHWDVDPRRFEIFLDTLPQAHRYAFEFRNPTWNSPAILDLLKRHNAAYCPYHLAGYQSPIEVTTDFTYIRLHGPGAKYQGSYADDALWEWAARIGRWAADLSAIYVYFDNDDSGYAAKDALRLREMTAASISSGHSSGTAQSK
ncbi:MAG TPA: DUF72 domain-containing protein [Bryobacteraceae bacterium]|nr:DUF72 domain-containing protein [Bryobacteraceae bacterium]